MGDQSTLPARRFRSGRAGQGFTKTGMASANPPPHGDGEECVSVGKSEEWPEAVQSKDPG